MRRRAAAVALGSLVLAWVVGPGCSRKGTPPPPAEDQDLQEIWAMYRGGKHQQGRVPRGLDDFKDLAPIHHRGFEGLKSGQYVTVWGVDLANTPNAGSKVLAHQKEAPTRGGRVLMADGSLKSMTAAEFQAAPKAGK